jgi:hypothetical protein
MSSTPPAAPEHNVTGIDFADRRHFRYTGAPLLDIHAHMTLTQPTDPVNAPPGELGQQASLDQAETMLAVACEFDVGRIFTMCPPDHIRPLRERFGDRLGFTGSIGKRHIDEPDDAAFRVLDSFLAEGVSIIKFWAAPRGRDRGLFVDAPWRIEVTRRARAAGRRLFMVHVADPDAWFRTIYADAGRYGTKPDQYRGLGRMLESFPELVWIGAHMGGDVEHPDHLEELLVRYPHLYLDTSATKWQVREASANRNAVRSLMCRYPERFLFGSDLVTRHGLLREHYVSRYWCQRTLWESAWEGRSPIADPDHPAENGQQLTPWLRGLELPAPVLEQVYHGNAERLLRQVGIQEKGLGAAS